MSGNKLATLLERDNNKITAVLVDAVVEWVLILLLLLNSAFSYLIIKYAEFFGVERPCPWCTMLDRVFDQTKTVCEAHAYHISKLGYCSNHRKLAQPQDMCRHCLLSTPQSKEFSNKLSFRVIRNKKEKVVGEVNFKCCCCCGARLDRDTTMFSSYLLLESWYDDVLQNWSAACNDHIQQGCVCDSADNDRNQEESARVSMSVDEMEELEVGMDAKEDEEEIFQEKASFQLFLEHRGRELADLTTETSNRKDTVDRDKDQDKNRSILDQMELRLLDFDINVEPNLDQNSLFLHAKGTRNLVVGVQEMAWEDVHTASSSEELAQMDNINENEGDVSIGMEIPDIDDNERDLPSTTSPNLDETDDHGLVQVQEQIEEGEVPNSPNQFRRVFLEKSDIESAESLDGSVTSELEGDEGAVTIESLKSALRAARKGLQALYTELEEERSASAEAVNQAMAMINRLHEEKAAMQMEAFQYQRMMEEQSEYDQEALQLMNDIMVKRDKEMQELEKKLLYHETKEKMRVFKKSSASSSCGVSSATCSISAEDSDGLYIDLNEEARDGGGDPIDMVMNLEESLADFEEERSSILAELNVLEEKLVLSDDENGDEHAHLNVMSHVNGFDSNGVHNSYASKFETESNMCMNSLHIL